MEWARQRFRISANTDSYSGFNRKSNSSNSNKVLIKSSSLAIFIFVAVVSVICLPCAVLSAEVRDNTNNVGDKTSNNFNSADHPNHREILHSKDGNRNNRQAADGDNIWRSLDHQAGSDSSSIIPRDGLSDIGESSNNASTPVEGLEKRNETDISVVGGGSNNSSSDGSAKKPKPPHHHVGKNGTHNNNHPHRPHGHDDTDCNKTKSSHGPGHRDHLHQKDSTSESEDDESDKIESILRDIFFDEFESGEEVDGDENLYEESHRHSASSGSDDSLSRSSSVLHDHDKSTQNKSQIPNSRRARSEPTTQHEGRAGPKGKSKGSRASQQKTDSNSKKGGGKQKKAGKRSSVSKGSDKPKYNEYMDSVFKRMNMMIKSKKMDPLRVNLYAGPNKTSKKSGGAAGEGGKKKYSARMNLDSEEFGEDEMDEDEDDDLEDGPARRDIFLNISHGHDHEHDGASVRKIRALLENVNGTGSDHGEEDSPRGNKNESKPKKPKQAGHTNRNKETGSSKNKAQGGNKGGNKGAGNKAGNKASKKKNNRAQGSRPTRGILHGLSSLKRDGDVSVVKQGEKVRLVRAKFFLGPVSLEIMPKKGKDGDKGKAAAATATAPKLKGILEVRLKKGSPTRIRKLKVIPPTNVKVEGGSASSTTGTKKGGSSKKPQQYGKVTPMATARLRQIASTVVRQADKSSKISP